VGEAVVRTDRGRSHAGRGVAGTLRALLGIRKEIWREASRRLTVCVGDMRVDRPLHCRVEEGTVTAARQVVDSHRSDPDTTFQDRDRSEK
jgi:hypothetical protein